MPAGLDQDDPTARQQPGLQVVLVGLARLAADLLGIGVLAAFDRIVDDEPAGAVAGDAGVDAGRHIFGPVAQRPAVGGARLAARRRVEDVLIDRRAHDRARPPPVLAGKVGAVGGEDDAAILLPAHQERRQHHRAISRFRRTGRHQNHGAAARRLDHLLHRLQQQVGGAARARSRCWRRADPPRPRSPVGPARRWRRRSERGWRAPAHTRAFSGTAPLSLSGSADCSLGSSPRSFGARRFRFAGLRRGTSCLRNSSSGGGGYRSSLPGFCSEAKRPPPGHDAGMCSSAMRFCLHDVNTIST